ncbi:hypothetical protein LPW26_08230 [Rhodopseudomonas sp. HC1]|uniref:hypothetical protein n=1 Tax=Rhodopseudomonas infernalis TaxID=2897386 RepID=UPI001EE7EE0F|nr:hypothetical protein [Rhodopseudomonas infernalis]MCG6204619.1 hypothetical protein [Rhodopseudomonas infernalis]
MFDHLMIALVVLSFGFPALPWLFGARWGAKGIWLSTALSLLLLLGGFPYLFGAACLATNCGQGAIAIFMLAPIWIVSALLTVGSAMIVWSRCKSQRQ